MPERRQQTTSNIAGLLDNYLKAKNAERASYQAPVDYRGQLEQEIGLQQQLSGVDLSGLPTSGVDTAGEVDIIRGEIDRIIKAQRTADANIKKESDAKAKADAEAKRTAEGFSPKLIGELEVFKKAYPNADFSSIESVVDIIDTDEEIKAMRAEMKEIAKTSKTAGEPVKPSSKGELVSVRLADGTVKNMRESDAPKDSEIIGKTGTASTAKSKIESEVKTLRSQYNRRSIVEDPATGEIRRVEPSVKLFPTEKRKRLFELELRLDQDRAPEDKIVREDASGNLIIVGEEGLILPRADLESYLSNR